MNGHPIVIVGAGPAGCTLAALLAMRGVRCLVFDDDKRPSLLVGESLLPTVVTLMRRLGIEDRVAAFSQLKPGVAFLHRGGQRLDFFFPRRGLGKEPPYAYNIPRPEFDRVLRERAEELGVRFVHRRARLEPGEGDQEIQLTRECLEATPELGGVPPKLLIDATGRARAFARVLELEARRGKRNDVACFAHYEGFEAESARDGQVVLSILDHGWSWRIPLPGRLSVGVVVDKAAAARHGATAEERLESIIEAEPILRDAGRERRRVSEVMTYANYQLISERGHGPGWIAVGDAFGFVDPMLSPGLFMAMQMAELVDRRVFAGGGAILDDAAAFSRAMKKVEAEMRDWHRGWARIIEYFYDGRIFSLYEGGTKLRERYARWALPALMEKHLTLQITRIVSGISTRRRYGHGLIDFTARHLMWDVMPPDHYAVKTS